MADPQAASADPIAKHQARTGKTIAELHAALAASGLAKIGERRSADGAFKLGYGDANAVALLRQAAAGLDGAARAGTAAGRSAGCDLHRHQGAPATLARSGDAAIGALGPCELAPKKTYISLRRKKQFAMLGPATKDLSNWASTPRACRRMRA